MEKVLATNYWDLFVSKSNTFFALLFFFGENDALQIQKKQQLYAQKTFLKLLMFNNFFLSILEILFAQMDSVNITCFPDWISVSSDKDPLPDPKPS